MATVAEKLHEYNLQTHPGIYTIEYTSDEEWLNLRQRGIGGSDIGGLMGISKYSSPLKVYKAKTEPVEQVDSVYTRKGHDLEPIIRDVYVKPYLQEKGYTVLHPDVMFVNDSCPWLIANLDAIAVSNELSSYRSNIVIEIKWVSEYGENRWGADEYKGVPPEYYAQVQHYMCVTGAQKAIVCALFDSTWEMHYYEIPFDMGFVMKMLDVSKQFYDHNMTHRVAPAPDVDIDRDELKEEVVEGIEPPTKASAHVTEMCAEYASLKEELKSKEIALRELGNAIVEAYRAGECPEEPYKVRMKTYKRTAFNQNAFRNTHPDLYEQFVSMDEYLRIYIGK